MAKKQPISRVLKQYLGQFVDFLPIVVPVALAVFTLTAVILLLVGLLDGVLVWLIGLPLALLASIVVARQDAATPKPGLSRDQRLVNILVALFVVGWVGFNVRYTSQHLITERDPGVYTAASLWVEEGSNLEVEQSTVFENTDGVRSYSGGFAPNNENPKKLNAQGAHALPALIGLSGRIVGSEHMLRLTVLFGGTALLAMYALARLMIKPAWAFVSVLTLSASLPLIYFSRDTYTEPLLATFTLGALALLWSAQKTQRAWLWFFAGLLAGAGVLTRIDAFMTVAAILGAVVVYVCLAAQAKRKQALFHGTLLIVGVFLTSLVGWLDVSQLSVSYHRNQWPGYIKPQVQLIGLILGTGALAVLASWRTNLLSRIDRVTKNWRGQATAVGVIALLGVIASRPLWYTAYATRKVVDETGKYVLSNPFRSYIESTFNWIVWYIGPVMAVFGVVGLAIVGYRAMRRKDLLYLAPFLVFAGTTCFYLIRPAIFPDQIWASRRFLSVIFPGMCILGALALERLYQYRARKILNLDGKTVATVLATLAVVGSLFVSWPFLFTREATWYAPVSSTCSQLPHNAAVLWTGSAGTQLIESTKSICNVDSQGYGRTFNTDAPSKELLARVSKDARNKGRTPIVGVYGTEVGKVLPGQESAMTVATVFSYNQVEKPFSRPPMSSSVVIEKILLAEILPDGSLRLVPATN